MGDLSISNTFAAGTAAVAADVNTNFTDVVNWANGSPNLSKAGSTTTVDGALQVDEAATLSTTLDVTGTGTFTGDLVVDTDTLYVDSTNNRVGIGTTSPDAALEVDAGSVLLDVGYGYQFSRSAVNQDVLYKETPSSTVYASQGDGLVLRNPNGSVLELHTSGSPRLTIDNTGDIGVGTTVPKNKLDVAGDGAEWTGTVSSVHDIMTHSAGQTGMGIYSGNTSDGFLRFADTDSQNVGGLHYDHNDDEFFFRQGGQDRVKLESSGNFDPHLDDTYSCGTSGRKWTEIWATDGSINTSDSALKTDVQDASLGLDFISNLRPVSYRWVETEGRPGVRRHHGFIAQEVAAALGDNASSTALWIDAPIEAEDAILEDDPKGRSPVPAVEAHNEQGLRYHELIAPLVKAVQELAGRVEALEA